MGAGTQGDAKCPTEPQFPWPQSQASGTPPTPLPAQQALARSLIPSPISSLRAAPDGGAWGARGLRGRRPLAPRPFLRSECPEQQHRRVDSVAADQASVSRGWGTPRPELRWGPPTEAWFRAPAWPPAPGLPPTPRASLTARPVEPRAGLSRGRRPTPGSRSRPPEKEELTSTHGCSPRAPRGRGPDTEPPGRLPVFGSSARHRGLGMWRPQGRCVAQPPPLRGRRRGAVCSLGGALTGV